MAAGLAIQSLKEQRHRFTWTPWSTSILKQFIFSDKEPHIKKGAALMRLPYKQTSSDDQQAASVFVRLDPHGEERAMYKHQRKSKEHRRQGQSQLRSKFDGKLNSK